MDVFNPTKRSWIMSRIKGKNTKPEKIIRSLLHKNGYRFRLHVKKLPGNPDIVLPRYRSVIFVHGCFWHGHQGCRRAILPTTRADFWAEKVAGNKWRDQMNLCKLEELGYKCLVVWQCEIKDEGQLLQRLQNFLNMPG